MPYLVCMAPSRFTLKIIDCILAIPHGQVATYGGIAAMAGNRRAARQVVRVLHTFSESKGLPWHRVVNREGRIVLPEHQGHDQQKALLVQEGVEFDHLDRIDLERFLWLP